MSMYPPVRAARQPYASAQDNPDRTAHDVWGIWLEVEYYCSQKGARI